MRGEFSKNTGPTCGGTTTCGPSRQPTAPSGTAISSLGASPVRTSPMLEIEPESAASAPACGLSLPESFAFFDPASFSWKTSQRCLTGGLIPFSATWPRAGMTRNGTAFRLPPLVPLISVIESILLPTLVSTDWKHSGNSKQRGDLLSHLIETIPAWIRCDCCENFLCTIHGKHAYECDCAPIEDLPFNPYLPARHGRLNPPFAEWLQGFPIGWTDLEHSATL